VLSRPLARARGVNKQGRREEEKDEWEKELSSSPLLDREQTAWIWQSEFGFILLSLANLQPLDQKREGKSRKKNDREKKAQSLLEREQTQQGGRVA
jgi:hypothetical protein